jgi:group I intron endonuclease
MVNNYIVYCYTNLINGKQYVGMTSMGLEERAGTNGTRYRNCPQFWEAINQYGWSNFASKVLAYDLTHSQACEMEHYYIEHLNSSVPNGYNLTSGGDKGFNIHDSTKQRISKSNKGNKSRTGYKNSEAHRKKMSEFMKGNKFNLGNSPSKETRQKLQLAQPHRVVVRQYTLSGEFVAEYPTIAEASRITQIEGNNIGKVALGKAKSAGGYIWKRSNVEEG